MNRDQEKAMHARMNGGGRPDAVRGTIIEEMREEKVVWMPTFRKPANTFQHESERARHHGNTSELGFIEEKYLSTKGAPRDISSINDANAYYQLEDLGLGMDYDWGQKNPNRKLPKTHTMPKDLRILDKYGFMKEKK